MTSPLKGFFKSQSDGNHLFPCYRVIIIGEKKHKLHKCIPNYASKNENDIINLTSKIFQIKLELIIVIVDEREKVEWDEILAGTKYVILFIDPSDSFSQRISSQAEKVYYSVIPAQVKEIEGIIELIFKKLQTSGKPGIGKLTKSVTM